MARILFMEDEEWQIITVLNALRAEYGYEVEFCDTIDSADRELRTSRYDVFVADIMMDTKGPIEYGKSAFVLVDHIREGEYEQAGNPSNLPIIFATGVSAMEMIWKDGNRTKVADAIVRSSIHENCCVEKPYMAEDLVEVIENILK